MAIETILLGSGVVISLVLGIFNLLRSREKVAIVRSEVYPAFFCKGTRVDTKLGDESYFIHNAALSLEVCCELVLVSGHAEIEVREVELKLDKFACDKLKVYFELPHFNRLFLYAEPMNAPSSLLKIKKPIRFAAERLFESTEKFRSQYGEYHSTPELIQPLFDKLENKYEICWTRYDDKKLCWKFPDKWWCNIGKRLWG